MDEVRILKTQLKDGRVVIVYDTVAKKGVNKYTVDIYEVPAPEFMIAMKNLNKHVPVICELPLPADMLDRINVTSVTFTWTNDIMGATITSTWILKNNKSPLNINTPHKTEESVADGLDDNYSLPQDCIEDLNTLIDESRNFINGVRSQIELDLNDVEDAA